MTEAAKEIIKAIGDLFGDRSVSKHTTLDDLEEIGLELDARMDALKEDIKRGQRGES